MTSGPLLAALIDLNGSPHSVGWGWFQVSAGNLAALVALVVLVAVTLVGRRSDG
jgi:hypothetical protein